LQSLAAAGSTIKVKIEERRGERKRGCDEGMWTYGHPFICLSVPSMVTVTVSLGIA